VTGDQSATPDTRKEVTVTPPQSPSAHQLSSQPDLSHNVSSPPEDTQALSQFVYPPRAFADEVEDEDAEGVWGYLLPLDEKGNGPLVLRKRDACDNSNEKDSKTKAKTGKKPQSSKDAQSPGGFLVGRHPECGKWQLCLYIEDTF
jgi:serine/threonine-protein kinase Chk2